MTATATQDPEGGRDCQELKGWSGPQGVQDVEITTVSPATLETPETTDPQDPRGTEAWSGLKVVSGNVSVVLLWTPSALRDRWAFRASRGYLAPKDHPESRVAEETTASEDGQASRESLE